MHSRVLAGRYVELPTLLPNLIFALLLPYVGSELAGEILNKERRRLKTAAQSPTR
jgi:hypothetical protein